MIEKNKPQPELVLSKSEKKKKKSKPWPLSKYEASGGCEKTLNNPREASLYREMGLNSSRVNSAEALSPAWWISSGFKATQGHVFHGRVPGWPITSVMCIVCVKELRPPLQRDRGRMEYFCGGIHLGWELRRSGQTQGCDGTANPHIEVTVYRRPLHSVVLEKLPNKLLIIWLMWACLWLPRTSVAMVAAAVADALAIQSNCTLCVSHYDDGWPLRTIHP